VFTTDSSGHGQGDIYDSESGAQILADSANPAKSGDTLVVYATGLGAVNPPVAAGMPGPSVSPAKTVNDVSVQIGGVDSKVLFSGLAPGFSGVYQVNVEVPAGLSDSDSTSFVLSVAGQSSASVTLALKNTP
jgi:minor extracellular serine protease Vpr